MHVVIFLSEFALRQNPHEAEWTNVGDICFFVPAKSGETMERFKDISLVDFSKFPKIEPTKVVDTYRGKGVCFA